MNLSGKTKLRLLISYQIENHQSPPFGIKIRSDKPGAYWLHAFEDWFSIDFISNLWGNSKNVPWPEKIVLISDRNRSDPWKRIKL
ncbi:MAG: hypothetical protein A2Y71_15350 [Bacteroidetes bacterium RBG_13_42_15]|nr:MAG: hypothetical protein A2Y71_15350 [Bacteroidetes bacterium RBG_13_42_15]